MAKNTVEKYKENLAKEIAEKENRLIEIEIEDKKAWEASRNKKEESFEERKKWSERFEEKNSIKRFLEEAKIEILPTEQKYYSYLLYTDVEAFKCVKEYTPNKVGIVRLKAEVTKESKEKLRQSFQPGGFCGHTDNSQQQWKFEMPEYTDEDIIEIRKHKDGYWYDRNGGRYGIFDHPYEFYDYNF